MPVELSIEVGGDVNFGSRLKQFAKTRLTEARRNIGRRSLAALQMMIPEKTGATRQAAYFKSRATQQGFQIDLGVAARRYSIFKMLVEGTSPHVITGNPLAFFWENGPEGPGYYFFYSVNHPGFKSKVNLQKLEREVERYGLAEMISLVLSLQEA
jgi:hypothetical protein